MSTWNNTRESLPTLRDNVQFIVAGHTAWLRGMYDEGGFHSRWFRYATSDVRLWRRVDEASRRPQPMMMDGAGLLEHHQGG